MSQNIVNLLGAGSGIDTQALVSQLVEVEKAAPQARIDSKRENFQTQISDLGLLNSALDTLKLAADAMGDADTFNSKSAAFANSTAIVPAQLDPEAQTGEYSFTVSQLAQAQSLSSETVFSDPSDAVGQGTLTFNFGAWDVATPPADPTAFTQDSTQTSQTITIDNTNNSLTGLANAINEANFGVQASIINDGTGYRLLMRADSGLNNQLQITATDTDGNNTDASGLSQFAFSASSFNMTQNQVGQDAAFTINGLSVTRTTNEITDVIDGFTFNLSGTTDDATGETFNITISDDKTSAETAVRDFVAAYNLFLETIEPLIGFNEETNDYGSLYRDSLAKSPASQIRSLLVADVEGLNSTFTALTNVGIRTELDGTLSIDEDDFTSAVDNNYDLFKNLFIPVTQSSTDQISINSFGDVTETGQYSVVITQAPSKESLTGDTLGAGLIAGLAADVPTSATLTGTAPTVALSNFVATSGSFIGSPSATTIPLDLLTQGAGANDYDFTITVDGVASAGNISLPVADYASYSDMATALQTAINGDANISGVTVSHANGQFTFASGTTGASSNVSFTTVGANAANLGIGSGTSTNGTGGTNDFDFTIAVDGTTSGTISLTPGTYATFSDLAAHMQTQINGDATLSGAGASVSVTHNGSQFVIASSTTGTSSTIAAITDIGASASTLGLSTGTAVNGATTGGNTTAYDFVITLDGITSGTISLDTATYADQAAVAAHIQTQINADTTLAAAGSGVDVTYDAVADAFTLVSRRYGAATDISITNVGGNAGDLGLSTGTATSGTDVAGTVNGVAGFGSGNVLLPALGQPGESLAMLIGENVTLNATNTMNFSRGFGGELELLLEQVLSNTGVLASRDASIDSDIEDLDEDQARLDRRIEAYEERLTAQFIAMEAIVRSLQDSSSFLETTLSNLLDSGNDN